MKSNREEPTPTGRGRRAPTGPACRETPAMPQTLVAPCPGCRQPLRLPAEWVGQLLRCKKCGTGLQARPRAAAPVPATPPAAPPAGPAVNAPAPAPYPANGYTPEPLPAEDAYTPAFLPSSGGQGSYRAKRRRMSAGKKVVFATVALLLTAGLAVGGLYFAKPDLFGKAPPEEQPPPATAGGENPGVEPPKPVTGLPTSVGPMPRRMLAVSVNNYLYANPTHVGFLPRGGSFNPSALAERLMQAWRLPKDQVYVLSDGTAGNRDSLPLKPIIEHAVRKFCETSRPQDRVILLFAGHAAEIEGECYLAPLEADLAEAKSLIPLKWVYEQLAACKAQQ